LNYRAGLWLQLYVSNILELELYVSSCCGFSFLCNSPQLQNMHGVKQRGLRLRLGSARFTGLYSLTGPYSLSAPALSLKASAFNTRAEAAACGPALFPAARFEGVFRFCEYAGALPFDIPTTPLILNSFLNDDGARAAAFFRPGLPPMRTQRNGLT
jgi:hypothetical protein